MGRELEQRSELTVNLSDLPRGLLLPLRRKQLHIALSPALAGLTLIQKCLCFFLMATALGQATRGKITLRGSTDIVSEFFGFSINSILYQRGIYPPESFDVSQKYGLRMMVTTNSGLLEYLEQVLHQLNQWLMSGHVQCLVLVISNQLDGSTLERWVFDIETDAPLNAEGRREKTSDKPEKEVTREIQAIMRQITSSVTFLPLLDVPCTFDLLVHTDVDTETPKAWEESDPKYLSHSSEVKLRSFTTKIHKVDAMVLYKNPDEDDD